MSDSLSMNPPAPRALLHRADRTSIGGAAPPPDAPSADPHLASAPFASRPWSPSTRGWLVPTEPQRAAAELEPRTQALALATNRAANAVALHTARVASFTMQERPPAKVLEEEEYLDNLERIIRRDFFPAVDAMQQRLAVPTPAWSGRLTASAATAARQRQADETPGATPHTAAALRHRAHRREGELRSEADDLTPALQRGDSPSRLEPGAAAAASASSAGASSAASAALIPHSSSNSAAAAATSAAAQTKLHPHELRLGSYLSLHTSEDNASFDAIQAKRRKQLDERRPWTSAEAEQKVNDTRIVLADDKERGGNMSGWKYKMRNRLFFYPDHEGRSELSADAYQSADTPAQQVAHALAQKSASIEYENTRFPGSLTNPFPKHNSSSKDRTGGASTPAAASASGGSAASVGGLTPAVGGYKLLRTPNLVPGAGESPLMTWGQVLATPAHLREEDADADVGALRLEPEDLAAAAADPSARFKIAPTPKRDQVAWGMAQAARSKDMAQKKRKRQDATPVPLSPALASPALHGLMARARPPPSPARGGGAAPAPATPMLSPAAQRLMASTLRAAASSPSHRGGSRFATSSALSGVDMQLRASYSPAHLAHGSSNARSTPSRATPRAQVPLFNSTPSPMPARR